MQVKVDYSVDCKQHNYDTRRPDCFAIYARKHFWNSWVEIDTYSDFEWCKRNAKKMAELPIYYGWL